MTTTSRVKRPYRHLKREDRIKIEALYNNGHSGREISKILGFNQSTICRELKKGMYEHTNSDLTTTNKYSYNKAQEITDINVSSIYAVLSATTPIWPKLCSVKPIA